MTKFHTKKTLFLSIFSIILSISLFVGTTFAWFTDSVSNSGNKIHTGTLQMSLHRLTQNEEGVNSWEDITESDQPLFDYDYWEPGYTAYQVLKIQNDGSLALKWNAYFSTDQELNILADVIDVYVTTAEQTSLPTDRNTVFGWTKVGNLAEFINNMSDVTKGNIAAGGVGFLSIGLHMDQNAANEYQNLSLDAFDINIIATQDAMESDAFGNTNYDSEAVNLPEWDGGVASSLQKDENGVYHITNASELAYLNTILSTLGVENPIKVSLDKDINLANKPWTPIGVGGNAQSGAFQGVFDGNGHTIYNLNVTAEGNYKYAGLFGFSMYGTTEIKNLTVKNFSVSGVENAGGIVGAVYCSILTNCHAIDGQVFTTKEPNSEDYLASGALVGALWGPMTGCSASNVTVNSNGYAGGLVGLTSNDGITPTITDCTIKNSTVIATFTSSDENHENYFVGYPVATPTITNSTYENVTLKTVESN